MHRGIVPDQLPDRRVVVQFQLTGATERNYWMVPERPEPLLCLAELGLEIDLVVIADMVTLNRV